MRHVHDSIGTQHPDRQCDWHDRIMGHFIMRSGKDGFPVRPDPDAWTGRLDRTDESGFHFYSRVGVDENLFNRRLTRRGLFHRIGIYRLGAVHP